MRSYNTIENVALWGLDLLEAATSLHRAGLSHGDIKPDNVVMAAGRATLSDLDGILDLRDENGLAGRLSTSEDQSWRGTPRPKMTKGCERTLAALLGNLWQIA